MTRTIKVMLLPNNKQQTKLFQYASVFRYAYNWALRKERENIKKGQGYLTNSELEERFTKLKKVEKYRWLSEIPEDIMAQAIKEAGNAYKSFLKGGTNCPKFRKKERSQPSFYRDNTKVRFTDTHIIVEALSSGNRKNRKRMNEIRHKQLNKIPTNGSYHDIRVSYDGKNWYITAGVMVPEEESNGVDKNSIHNENAKKRKKEQGRRAQTVYLIKDIYENAGTYLGEDVYRNTEILEKVKKLEKRKRRLQRSIARKYEKNKKGDTYYKTRNIIKKEKELQKLSHRLMY